MKIALLFLSGIVFTFSAIAQWPEFNQLKGLQWRSIGPAGMSGRVTAIDVVRTKPQVIYAGTASGGVWKSESGGVKWEPIFDDQPTQSIGALAICQQNPDIVWVGTGEGNPRNSQNSGKGIFRSLDGGKTWQNMGLEKSKTIHRVIIDPNDCNTVYAGVSGSAWGGNPDRGVFKTIDGGKSWKKVLYVNDSTGCADLVMDPSNPNKMIAAMWHYNRQPWTFTSGGKGSGLYITWDGGENWTRMTDKNGLPKGNLGRIGLAIAPSNPNIVYALIESSDYALYKSQDGGRNWTKINDKDVGNRPFYYADIFVHSKNENIIYNLYSVTSRSIDGGKSFQTILPYYGVHPDHHAWYIHPDNPDYMIDGNDGGLNITYDGGASWRFINNIPVGQFYHINVDNDMPYKIYGGLQDNGSWVGPSAVWQDGGIRNHHWQEVLFGDGFDVMPRADDSRYLYAMYQGGNLYMVDTKTGENIFIRPNHPDYKPLRYNWNAALAQDPFEKGTIYYGSQYVHKSKNFGLAWEIISPDLTTNDTSKQKQHLSGGLTIDATAAENFTTILCIAPSPLEKDVLWVGTDDGNIQISRDGGKSWNNVAGNIKEMAKGAYVPQIEVSRHKKGEAWVVVNDYRRNNWKPFLFHTSDYGKTWRNLASDKVFGSFVLSVVSDPVEPNLLFAGADDGLYVTIDGGKNWKRWNKGFPAVPVQDMKIQERDADLVVGTFGRAIWILDDITPLRKMAADVQFAKKPFSAMSVMPAYMVNFKSYEGMRFDADGDFSGQNEQKGARFHLWVNPAAKPAKGADKDKKDADTLKKPDWDKIQIVISNHDIDTVRYYTVKADTGLHRIYWRFEKNGVQWPSWRDRDPKADPQWGRQVLPGKYKVRMTWGTFSDTASVEVFYDPRTMLREKQLLAQEKDLAKIDRMATVSNEAFEQLKGAKKTLGALKDQMESVLPDKKKAIEEKAKTLSDTLNKLTDIFMLPESSKLFDHVTKRLNQKLWHALEYISSSGGEPTENARLALKSVEIEVDAMLVRVNRFFAEDWAEFRKMVEAAQPSPFKQIKELKR